MCKGGTLHIGDRTPMHDWVQSKVKGSGEWIFEAGQVVELGAV